MAGNWRELEIRLLSLPPTDWGPRTRICRHSVNGHFQLVRHRTGGYIACVIMCLVCDNLSGLCDNLSQKSANLKGLCDNLSSLCDILVLQDDFPTKIVAT